MNRRSLFRVITLFAVFATVGCDRPRETEWLDLEIREQAQEAGRMAVSLPPPTQSEEREGFETRSYLLPLSWLLQWTPSSDSGTPIDPFAAPDPIPRPAKFRTPREMLESYGISFPEGSRVDYDPDTSILEVTNEVDELHLVDAVLFSGCYGKEALVYLRIEFLELETDRALVLERSSMNHFDHRTEWEAARESLRRGDARLVDSVALMGRSGQRLNFDALPSSSGETLGLEFDPVIGGDDTHVDLRLALDWRSGDSGAVPVRIETQFTAAERTWRLLGAWPASAAGKRRYLAFLTVVVQQTSPKR